MAADGSIAEAAEIRVHADGNDRAKEPAAAILIAVCWLFLNGQRPTQPQRSCGDQFFLKNTEQRSSWLNKGVRGWENSSENEVRGESQDAYEQTHVYREVYMLHS